MAGIRKAREILVGMALALLARDGRADERVECASAYERTQRAQQKSELISALDSAERCARPTCPALLSNECNRWVGEIRQKLPGLLVRVKSADGCPHEPSRVDVGGATRKEPDNDTLFLDPGTHEITVTDPVSRRTKTETIAFAPRERRDIDFDFASPTTVCGGGPQREQQRPSPPERNLPRTSLIIGGIGGGLVLVGVTLGLVGVAKRGGLDDCKPNCSNDRLDSVRSFFVAGDVVAGLGVLALGAAVVTLLTIDRSAASALMGSRTGLVVGSSGVGASF
jgi:hypothetical protein